MPEGLDYHVIVEQPHSFLNPTSEEKLDQLIACCGLRDGHRVLDVGCGKAWLLRRMARAKRIDGVGVELREAFLSEARGCIEREPGRGSITLIRAPALSYAAEPASFDVCLCIGASFAIGSFEAMVAWLKPLVRGGGVLAVGDIYAIDHDMPPESAKYFGVGAIRTLSDTVDVLAAAGCSLVSVIASSKDDWDRYESLRWLAAEDWLREHPDHPEAEAFRLRTEREKHDYLRRDRDSLGWAIFVCRVA
jgi:cyclopropane fatty-acyl-phospholipid synthase-like methyltransferase